MEFDRRCALGGGKLHGFYWNFLTLLVSRKRDYSVRILVEKSSHFGPDNVPKITAYNLKPWIFIQLLRFEVMSCAF
jgi:hypothetical protein